MVLDLEKSSVIPGSEGYEISSGRRKQSGRPQEQPQRLKAAVLFQPKSARAELVPVQVIFLESVFRFGKRRLHIRSWHCRKGLKPGRARVPLVPIKPSPKNAALAAGGRQSRYQDDAKFQIRGRVSIAGSAPPKEVLMQLTYRHLKPGRARVPLVPIKSHPREAALAAGGPKSRYQDDAKFQIRGRVSIAGSAPPKEVLMQLAYRHHKPGRARVPLVPVTRTETEAALAAGGRQSRQRDNIRDRIGRSIAGSAPPKEVLMQLTYRHHKPGRARVPLVPVTRTETEAASAAGGRQSRQRDNIRDRIGRSIAGSSPPKEVLMQLTYRHLKPGRARVPLVPVTRTETEAALAAGGRQSRQRDNIRDRVGGCIAGSAPPKEVLMQLTYRHHKPGRARVPLVPIQSDPRNRSGFSRWGPSH